MNNSMSAKTILIVDDNEAEQFLCSSIIEEYNDQFEILSAYDGVEALEVIDNLDKSPDVILLDINMPRMNGLEFLDEFSAKYPNVTVVVAMLTSSLDSKDQDIVLKYECVTDYFAKPLRKDHLDKIMLHLEGN